MRKNVTISFLLSLLFLLSLNLTVGTYFDTYEAFINAILISEFTFPVSLHVSMNAYSFFTPLISNLNDLLNLNIAFSLVTSILNLCFITIILSCLLFILDFKKITRSIKILTLIIVLFLLSFLLIKIHNNSLAALSTITFCFYLYVYKHYKLNKIHLIPIFLLFLTSISIRLEIMLIVLLLFTFFTFLFKQELFNSSLKIFICSVLFYVAYLGLLNVNNEFDAIFAFENASQDNSLIDYFSPLDTAKFYQLQAMGRFIIDTPNFTIQDYNLVLNQLGSIKLTNNVGRFLTIYVEKICTLFNNLSLFYFHFIFVHILFLYASISYASSKKNVIKIVIFYLSVFLLPFGISLFLICSPNLLYVLYISLGLFSLIYLLDNNILNLKKIFFLLLLIVSISIHSYSQIYKFQTEEMSFYSSLRNDMIHSKNEGQKIMISYPLNFKYYPSRLFFNLQSDRISHHYLDLAFMNYIPEFRNYNIQFFGDGFYSLKERMIKCADNEKIIIYSKEEYNNFIINYMKIFYDENFKFELIENIDILGEVNKYHLKYCDI